MKIDFYHWDYQCPISYETINLLNKYKSEIHINIYDINNNPRLSKEKSIFFPFLTIFDNNIRYRGPLKEEIIEKYLKGEKIVEKKYRKEISSIPYKGDIIPLNKDNIYLIKEKCTLSNNIDSCNNKRIFLEKTNDLYGFVNISDHKVVGGAEYVPSLACPYDIPKDKDTAFITCVYHSSKEYDYKYYPLKKLEEYLSSTFNKLIVISDEIGVFPNGDLDFFIRNGYKDNGIISVEENYAKLHLLSKDL